jgi:hypothetical protein
MRHFLANLIAGGVIAVALSFAYITAGGGPGEIASPDTTDPGIPLEVMLAQPVSCAVCSRLDEMTRAFGRLEGPVARGVAVRLAAWRGECDKEQLCRTLDGADPFLEDFARCKSDGHLSVFGRLNRLAELAMAQSASCQDQSCPQVDCAARAEIGKELKKISDALGVLGSPTDEYEIDEDEIDANSPTESFRKAAEEHLETLNEEFLSLAPLLADFDPHSRSLAQLEAWLSRRQRQIHRLADQIDASFEEYDGAFDEVSEGLWRMRTLAFSLVSVAEDVGALRKVKSDAVAFEGDFPESAKEDGKFEWGDLADSLGQSMVYMARLDSVLKRYDADSEEIFAFAGGEDETCMQQQKIQASMAAAKIRRATAMLDFCGVKSGCDADEDKNRSFLSNLTASTSAIADRATAERYLESLIDVMEEELVGFDAKESERVELSSDLSTYYPGDAIKVTATGRYNMCLAAGGTWIGVYEPAEQPLSANGEVAVLLRQNVRPLDERETASRAENETILEAPSLPGTYDVRLFASPARGDSELGAAKIDVIDRKAGCDGFNGSWDTSEGLMRLSVRGREVRGTYRKTPGAKAGFVFGQIRNGVLKGKWSTEFGEGGLRLELSNDGNDFNGTAGWSPDQHTGAGQWEGQCHAVSGQS